MQTVAFKAAVSQLLGKYLVVALEGGIILITSNFYRKNGFRHSGQIAYKAAIALAGFTL
jgi:hypothetical protein